MQFKEFADLYLKMCQTNTCESCPLSEIEHKYIDPNFCRDFIFTHVDEVESKLLEFKQNLRTNKYKFLEKYPNAPWSVYQDSPACPAVICMRRTPDQLPCDICAWWNTEYKDD